jgi:hypothetical protein
VATDMSVMLNKTSRFFALIGNALTHACIKYGGKHSGIIPQKLANDLLRL